ncbi:hypothetical protein HanHA300_Chr00c0094g0709471 [Helianthus annuus]|nr:hypothetical protein HanHA300_Chr00c0094g0709471 [Helianthus annuus]
MIAVDWRSTEVVVAAIGVSDETMIGGGLEVDGGGTEMVEIDDCR